MERGTRIHAAIARAIETGDTPDDSEAAGIWHWIADNDRLPVSSGVAMTEFHGEDLLGGCQVTGTADVVIGDGVVIDWKTGEGRNLPPLCDDLQMVAYAALFGSAGETVTVFRVLVDRRIVESLGFDVDECRERIAALASEIRQHQDRYEMGDHCHGCRVRHVCPLYRHEASPLIPGEWSTWGGEPITEENALAIARAVSAAQALIESAKKELKKRGGVVDTERGKVWGADVVDIDEVVSPKLALLELHKRFGLDAVANLMTTTKTKISEVCRSAGADAGEVLVHLKSIGAITTKQQERWQWRKL